MAIPTIVQTPNVVAVSGSSTASLTFGAAVAAGNSLIAVNSDIVGQLVNWNVSDNVNASTAWPLTVKNQPSGGRAQQINHLLTSSAGTPTVTWRQLAGTWSGFIWAVEVSGLDTAATIVTSSHTSTTTNSTNHQCGTTVLDSTDCFVVGSGAMNADGGTTVEGSSVGYAMAPGLSSTRVCIQYKAVALQSDSGYWRGTGSARLHVGAMAAFPGVITAGAATRPPRLIRLLGYGR